MTASYKIRRKQKMGTFPLKADLQIIYIVNKINRTHPERALCWINIVLTACNFYKND